MKRILFVDDDPQVLSGLQRLLHPFRNEWEMAFADGGAQALRLLSAVRWDILITDVCMTGLSGIELLGEARERYPDMVRIVLSGTADQAMALQTVGLAHQYLLKPCEPKVLKATIARAFNLRRLIDDEAVRRVVSAVRSIPSLPRIYLELIEAMESPETTASQVGAIVARDIGMASSVLQLVNSALFAPVRRIVDPVTAVVYLGHETIRALATQVVVFSRFDGKSIPEFSIVALQRHSMRVAGGARVVALNAGLHRKMADECMAAGFLHDVGKLILASNFPERYRAVLDQLRKNTLPMHDAELAEFGTTHAEIGAYLLALWGLPETLTESVRMHHNPPLDPTGKLSRATVVYMANLLDQSHPQPDCESRCLDLARASGLDWEELRIGIQ